MAMKKNEVLEVIKNGLELKTKKEAGEVLATVDAVIEVLIGALDSGEKVNVGNYIALHRKSLPAQEGVAMGKAWSKPARDEIVVKRLSKLKNALIEE